MSAYTKTVLCLADSRRFPGSCVAGKEFSNGKIGGWIRPVDSANQGTISENDKLYEDGSHAQLLDIVEIPLQKPVPHLHHQEDHEIDASEYWEKKNRATWEQVHGQGSRTTMVRRGPQLSWPKRQG
jgi:hypothetical protein